jgi:hypothetical protein
MATVTITPDAGSFRTPEGGGAVTAQTALFMHIGGPFDGERLLVEVDDNGIPVEVNPPRSFALGGGVFNPDALPRDPRIFNTYERDVVMDGDGIGYVFRYRGTDTLAA